MSLSPAFLDELRARVSVSSVVARRVKLTRAGREMKGCCPFHNEKTPSFYVNDDKGFYHCFGCGKHGDVIRFLTDADGLSFMEAVKQLAGEAGIDVPAPTPQAREQSDHLTQLAEVTGKAAAWFTDQLAADGGKAARDYLERRAVTPATAAAFGIGYAPDSRNRLKAALASAGEPKLLETGLIGQAEDGTSYDRFRGRLIFPIRDPRGRVVGFGGRALGDAQPKYLNSPDGPLFDKGRLLYNLDRAAPAARKAQRLVVVEGYLDVIAVAQAGVAEAVAPLGTAMTEAQLGLCWRLVPEPILCFDGDAAGQRAALRACLRALPLLSPGKSLRLATLPPGQDPDDLVRSGGAAAFEAVLDAAEPLIERLWQAEAGAAATDTPERRAAVRQRLQGHAASIADASVRALYAAEFAQRFDAMFLSRPQRAPNGRFTRPPPISSASPQLRARAARSGDGDMRALVAALLLRPALADHHGEAVAALRIEDVRLAAMRDAILANVAARPDVESTRLLHHLREAGAGPLAEALISPDPQRRLPYSFTRGDAPDDQAAREFAEFVGWLHGRQQVGRGLGVAGRALRAGLDEASFARQRALHAERIALDRAMMRLAESLRDD